MKAPRRLRSITRSSSSSVASSNFFGIAVPALFTNTSSLPSVATVFRPPQRLDRRRSRPPATRSPCRRRLLDRLDDRRRRVRSLRVGDGDCRAVGGQPLGDRRANPARAAGHQRNFAFKRFRHCDSVPNFRQARAPHRSIAMLRRSGFPAASWRGGRPRLRQLPPLRRAIQSRVGGPVDARDEIMLRESGLRDRIRFALSILTRPGAR